MQVRWRTSWPLLSRRAVSASHLIIPLRVCPDVCCDLMEQLAERTKRKRETNEREWGTHTHTKKELIRQANTRAMCCLLLFHFW